MVVQKVESSEVNWIIETKGRVWEGIEAKDEALKTWCEQISAVTGTALRYVRINQTNFDPQVARRLQDLIATS